MLYIVITGHTNPTKHVPMFETITTKSECPRVIIFNVLIVVINSMKRRVDMHLSDACQCSPNHLVNFLF